MKHAHSSFPILLILLCAPAQAFGEQTDTAPCAERSVAAIAVRTEEDVRGFVQCAYEFVQEMGFAEARRAFHEEGRWRNGPTYVFVSEHTPMTDRTRSLVFPPNPSREGTTFGQLLIDAFGNYYKERYRLLGIVEEGWVYYAFTNPATGREEPKASYVKRLDWEGTPAVIGAGIYRRDLPATCEADEVNASLLESDPSHGRLQEFVRCAAMELESKGYFAGRSLASDPRWRGPSTYVFGMDIYGNTIFTGDPHSQWYGGAVSEVNTNPDGPFLGRDMIGVGDVFGETFVYYLARNPATGRVEPKTTFIKRVVVNGLPMLLASGYYVD